LFFKAWLCHCAYLFGENMCIYFKILKHKAYIKLWEFYSCESLRSSIFKKLETIYSSFIWCLSFASGSIINRSDILCMFVECQLFACLVSAVYLRMIRFNALLIAIVYNVSECAQPPFLIRAFSFARNNNVHKVHHHPHTYPHTHTHTHHNICSRAATSVQTYFKICFMLYIPIDHKICQMDIKIWQMTVKYTNIFYSKALKSRYTQIVIFGIPIYHLATLLHSCRPFTF
jgi:hypothetical protein